MKLNRYHVIIIGVVVCFAVAAGMYFGMIKGVQKNIAAKQTEYDTAQATAAKYEQVRQSLEAAQLELASQQARLAKYMKTRMPDISLTDRIQGMIALWRECSDIMGPTIERFMSSRPGVSGISGIQIKGPSTNPNDIKANRIDVPLGTVQVRVNNFRNALTFIKQLKYCPRLVYITSLRLDGPPNPDLTLHLGMNAYIFPTGDSAPIAEASAGGDAGGGVPGMGGGMPMPGGVPGGPPAGGPPMPMP